MNILLCGKIPSQRSGTNPGQVQNTGENAQINLQVAEGDINGLVKAFEDGGIPIEQAKELAEIAAADEDSVGDKVKTWLGEKLLEGADAAWGVGQAAGIAYIKLKLNEFFGVGD